MTEIGISYNQTETFWLVICANRLCLVAMN
jgi:hypothetical protein